MGFLGQESVCKAVTCWSIARKGLAPEPSSLRIPKVLFVPHFPLMEKDLLERGGIPLLHLSLAQIRVHYPVE